MIEPDLDTSRKTSSLADGDKEDLIDAATDEVLLTLTFLLDSDIEPFAEDGLVCCEDPQSRVFAI